MLTTNEDISDRFINGQLDQIYHFETSQGTVTKLYIKFDDATTGLKAFQSTLLAWSHIVVPRNRGIIRIAKVLNMNHQMNSVPYYAHIGLHNTQGTGSYTRKSFSLI